MIELTTKVQDQPRGTTAICLTMDPKHHLAKTLHEQALAAALIDANESKFDVFMVTVRIEVRVYGKAFDQPFAADPVLSESIDTLNLSVRASNILDMAGVKTIGDLVAKTEYDILHMRHGGRVSLREIVRTLAARGLSLKERVPA